MNLEDDAEEGTLEEEEEEEVFVETVSEVATEDSLFSPSALAFLLFLLFLLFLRGGSSLMLAEVLKGEDLRMPNTWKRARRQWTEYCGPTLLLFEDRGWERAEQRPKTVEGGGD